MRHWSAIYAAMVSLSSLYALVATLTEAGSCKPCIRRSYNPLTNQFRIPAHPCGWLAWGWLPLSPQPDPTNVDQIQSREDLRMAPNKPQHAAIITNAMIFPSRSRMPHTTNLPHRFDRGREHVSLSSMFFVFLALDRI